MATLCDFDQWLTEIVTVHNNVQANSKERADHLVKPVRTKRTRSPQLNILTANKPTQKCFICSSCHTLNEWPSFTAATAQQRAEMLEQHGKCFSCFESNHQGRHCKTRKSCNVDGCRSKHHPLLDGALRVFPKHPDEDPQSDKKDVHACSGSISPPSSDVLLSIVRARLVTNGDTALEVNVLLDPGSEATLVREDIAQKVGLTGPVQNIRLGTFHGRDPTFRSQKVRFQLHSLDARHKFSIDDALTVPTINVAQRKTEFSRLKNLGPHFKNVSLNTIGNDGVAILLGMGIVEAHEQYRVLKPPHGVRAPRAIQTPFGWCVTGPTYGNDKTSAKLCSTQHVYRISHTRPDDLAELVKNQWSIESLGVQKANTEPMSNDDKRALQILETTTKKVNGRYECSMLWKNGIRDLPDTLPTAQARISGLERRFRRNTEFAQRYNNVIEEYFQAGHADALLTKQNNCGLWFLPHHAVENPKQPGKVRVVFDASARTNGISLNDLLLTGPDMLTSLFNLLLRFREFQIAVSADIARMFHQVRITEEDRTMLAFLWRNPSADAPVRYFNMKVHMFGAVCSPSVCTRVLRRTAQDHKSQFPAIWKKVSYNFYVDNYLDSFMSEQEAQRACHDLKLMFSYGGFHLTKWLSSSRSILKTFGPDELSQPNLNINNDPLPIERTLGVIWNSEEDTFCFCVGTIPTVSTKRGMLRVVSSVFDPLGFVSPIILRAKHILRQTWLLNFDWDSPLPESLLSQWRKWVAELPLIERLPIRRSLMSFDLPQSVEIHLFCDASEHGYGGVAYLRKRLPGKKTSVTFICSKARVAPLKYSTIPRLELQAALISSRLGLTLLQELRLQISNTFYWTDSLTVLHWLNATGRRYSTFVMNRVAEISDNSKPSQWLYVPTRDNPADESSRGCLPAKLTAQSRWFAGPAFLYEEVTSWPRRPDHTANEADVEDLPVKWAGYVCTEQGPLNELIHNQGNIKRLRRIVAKVIRLVKNCRLPRHERKKEHFSADEVKRAFITCVNLSQRECFEEEISATPPFVPTCRYNGQGPVAPSG